jgi:hypothetical protein
LMATAVEKHAEARTARENLIRSGTLEGDIAEGLAGQFPLSRTNSLLTACKAVAEYIEAREDGYTRMEAVGAHIDTESVTYPNGSVGIDAAGNLVSVEFDGPVIVE